MRLNTWTSSTMCLLCLPTSLHLKYTVLLHGTAESLVEKQFQTSFQFFTKHSVTPWSSSKTSLKIVAKATTGFFPSGIFYFIGYSVRWPESTSNAVLKIYYKFKNSSSTTSNPVSLYSAKKNLLYFGSLPSIKSIFSLFYIRLWFEHKKII